MQCAPAEDAGAQVIHHHIVSIDVDALVANHQLLEWPSLEILPTGDENARVTYKQFLRI